MVRLPLFFSNFNLKCRFDDGVGTDNADGISDGLHHPIANGVRNAHH